MSVASPPTANGSPASVSPLPSSPPPGEACPLCGAPLHPEQEWCVHCGAAARTRLAAAPNWKKPIAVLALVVALSLGVIAAALIALAGNSTSNVHSISVVTSPAAGVTPSPGTVPTATTPQTRSSAPSTTAPQTSLPGASTTATGAPATGRPSTTVPGIGSLPKHAATAPSSPAFHVKLSPKAKEEIRRALAKTAP